LNVDAASAVIQGIAAGCEQAGAALVGGETAEMPGMYQGEDYDLAGFCVGVVEKSKVIDGRKVQPGDVLIGLASSGAHSNGYSLIRKIIEVSAADLQQPFDGATLIERLLAPTRIYVKPLLKLFESVDVHALAHITGGGLIENIPRVLPAHTQAVIDPRSWQRPAIFDWLQRSGGIADEEMYRVFNCGIGMVLVVAPAAREQTLRLLTEYGETPALIGQIARSENAEPYVLIADR
jgi:phosphoribosylformylglycinamidine cyclo-ligase